MVEKNKNWNWCIILALGLGTLALYSPVLGFDYINFDDPRYIIHNYHIGQGITWTGFKWCFQAGYASNWHPVTWMSHMFDCQIFGQKPGGPHAVNVLLHAANSVLLFLILFRLTGARWRSAFVAALFAWHPMHVESVAWISERKDVLSTLFWMLTTLAYLHYVQKRNGPRYLLVLTFFAIGLMAKQMIVTLPFVLLLLDWWPLGRFQATDVSPAKPWRLVLEKIPFFPLIVVSSIFTVIAQTRGGAISDLQQIPWLARVLTAEISYYRYFFKLIWPTHLSIIYTYEFNFSHTDLFNGLIVLATLTFIAIKGRKTQPYLLVGWLWFLGTLVPVIGFVQVGAQSMADRYTYIPSIGLFVMIAWGAADFLGAGRLSAAGENTGILPRSLGLRRKILAAVGIVLVTASAIATRLQLRYWQDGGALFAHSIAATSDNYVSHGVYAAYLRDHGQLEKARFEAQTAIDLAPAYEAGHCFLGEILMKQGKLDEAITQLNEAKKLRPNAPQAYFILGNTYLLKNEPEKALVQLTQACKIDPSDPTIPYAMSDALLTLRKNDQAESALQQALHLAPNYAVAHNRLAGLLAAQKRTAEAIQHYRAAIKNTPDFPEALNNLAWIFAANPDAKYRDGTEAVRLASRACELTQYKEPLLMGTLAAAYAEAAKFTEAQAMAKKTIDLALAFGDKSLAERNRELMALYQAHQAFHETNAATAHQ